jgi:hypothetical protein
MPFSRRPSASSAHACACPAGAGVCCDTGGKSPVRHRPALFTRRAMLGGVAAGGLLAALDQRGAAWEQIALSPDRCAELIHRMGEPEGRDIKVNRVGEPAGQNIRVHRMGEPAGQNIRVHGMGEPAGQNIRVHGTGAPAARNIKVHPTGEPAGRNIKECF